MLRRSIQLCLWFGSCILCLLYSFSQAQAQQTTNHKGVWIPDIGNGNYQNPILFADYADPDVCRVGKDYYLVASSFDAVPGLPILHSRDLVNWKIIGHALPKLIPVQHFSRTQQGNGVWAPAIRYHRDSFYIYYPDPDFGIYLIKAKHPEGPWTKPLLILKGKGLIDPCPFWDDDGKAYLIHAFAGSRAGIKSILVIHQMNQEGTKVLDHGVIVYDGHGIDPTIEGPKLYKRNGYYYIFAPAGGVPQGYQLVLRSKHIYGPYERKIVLHQGNTSINGPHQGAWVTTPDGKQDWFIHFRDMGAYGRVTYLEPMKWINNWPMIGVDQNGDGIGEPVEHYVKPDVGKIYPTAIPQASDEFNNRQLGLQWQWQANPQATWYYLTASGWLRLYAQPLPPYFKNYWDVPNILMQKFPAPQFQVITKFNFHPLQKGDQVGFIIMGKDYAYLAATATDQGIALNYAVCKHADEGHAEQITPLRIIPDSTIYFRVLVDSGARCQFSYSWNGKDFISVDQTFIATPGKWIGAKIGLFCTSTAKSQDAGYVDVDWFRILPVQKK
ncbi:MAG: glycoside hydrolase 43 family protein [Thermoflavifilum sp.]|nr:glycoside hydrolase 43 family protein [Thermoflavifilum sp.]